VELYPHAYQPRLGPLRPVIPQVVHKFLDCGNLDRGFARSCRVCRSRLDTSAASLAQSRCGRLAQDI
jgi:hypothetical protein